MIIFCMMCTLLASCVFHQVSYAYDYPLVTLDRLEGYAPYFLEDTEDKVYIRLSFYERELSFQMYDTLYAYGLAKINTLYETFVITDYSNQVLKTFTDFDYVEIDSQTHRDDGLVTFRTEDDVYVCDTTIQDRFYVYILKDIEYDPAGEDLVFTTDVDLLRPIDDFNEYFVGWDNYDGKLDIEIADDQYTPNKHILGTYNITLVLTDSSNNKKYLTYQIQVKDMTAPEITPQNEIIVSYTNDFDVTEFVSSLEVFDNVSTREELSIEIVEDQYSTNKLNLGTYDLKIEVKDQSENSSIYTQKIKVIDDISPVITGTIEYTKQAEDELLVQTLISNLMITDDYTVNPKISITKDQYSASMYELGTYTIDLKVTDNDGNASYITLTVQVVDEIEPVFFLNLGLVQMTDQSIINQTELRTLIEQKIPINYDYFDIILDEYTEHAKEAGIYRVNLNVYSNDSIHNFQLLIRVNEIQSSTDQHDDENSEINLWLVYGLGSAGLITVSSALFFFIKKKRSKLN